MSELRYHADAADEVVAAVDYYAAREPDLAFRFDAELRDLEIRVREESASFAVFDSAGDVLIRRALMGDFPFAVLFTRDGDTTWIVAVMHLRRAPGYWRSRV